MGAVHGDASGALFAAPLRVDRECYVTHANIVFRSCLIDLLARADGDVAIAVDRSPGRRGDDDPTVAGVCIDGRGRVVKAGVGLGEAGAALVGVARLSARAVEQVIDGDTNKTDANLLPRRCGSEEQRRGPLEFAALWQIAQRLTDRPVKFGTICAPGLASMLWNEHYAEDKAMVLDLCDIMNAELRELAAAGCPVIQVEEPRHHGLTTRPDCTEAELEFQTEAFNRQLAGIDAEIWVHTCWGNPNQQRVYWEVPSYERDRFHGQSNLNTFRDGLRVLRTILSELRRNQLLRRGRVSAVPGAEQGEKATA